MKTLAMLLILVLLPFSVSVDAGVKFETYNPETDNWSVNVEDIPIIHDTLREYLTIVHDKTYRIECDSLIEHIWYERAGVNEDFQDIKHIEWIKKCDTTFRHSVYREVWAPKVQVWLTKEQWQKLMRILEEQ